jgi:hypothetical protein
MLAIHPPLERGLPKAANQIPSMKALRERLARLSDTQIYQNFKSKCKSFMAEFLAGEKLQVGDLCRWKDDQHKERLEQLASKFIDEHGGRLWPDTLVKNITR